MKRKKSYAKGAQGQVEAIDTAPEPSGKAGEGCYANLSIVRTS